MEPAYEILRVVGGRVFDVESYECTAVLGEELAAREPGYYLACRNTTARDTSTTAVVGPFVDLRNARRAASDPATRARLGVDENH